jgi:predicted transposase/invertase (TIGR01784 family)
MDTLEISKDSFIEADLADYYSDILYKVMFTGGEGFLYLLFEHKSYEDGFIQFQLFGYIYKIYSLYVKQTRAKHLPIVIPMVLYHGRKKWEIGIRFSDIIKGPYEALCEYVPDFKYILFDLTQYSDAQIKGEVQARVLLLLLKHAFNPDIAEKLPQILSLFSELIQQETGLQTIEALLRYIFSTIEEESMETVKEIVKKSLSAEKGESVMGTIAERFINEGIEQGVRQGLQLTLEGIEMVLDLKFGEHGLKYMGKIRQITDVEKLKEVMNMIKRMRSADELKRIIN